MRQARLLKRPVGGPAWAPARTAPLLLWVGHLQGTLRAAPLPWAPRTAGRVPWPCAPSFSAIKSLLSMAVMEGRSRDSLSLEDRSLLRVGTGLCLMAVPWLQISFPRATAGRQGRGAGNYSCVGAELAPSRVSGIQLSWSFLIKAGHAHCWSLCRRRQQCVCSALDPSSAVLDIAGWHPVLA